MSDDAKEQACACGHSEYDHKPYCDGRCPCGKFAARPPSAPSGAPASAARPAPGAPQGDKWATLITDGEAAGCYPCDTCNGFRAAGSNCQTCGMTVWARAHDIVYARPAPPAATAPSGGTRREALTYEDGIDAAVDAVLARYDICVRNHEAATYLTHGKMSDDEPTLDRMEWVIRRSEAMKCRDAIRALASAPREGGAEQGRAGK
jgi:hypothetical protein